MKIINHWWQKLLAVKPLNLTSTPRGWIIFGVVHFLKSKGPTSSIYYNQENGVQFFSKILWIYRTPQEKRRAHFHTYDIVALFFFVVGSSQSTRQFNVREWEGRGRRVNTRVHYRCGSEDDWESDGVGGFPFFIYHLQ